MTTLRIAPLGVLAVVTAVSSTVAQSAAFTPTITFSSVPGTPKNLVPGLGIPFQPSTSTIASIATFGTPVFSSDESHFALRARAATGDSLTDSVLLLDGALVMQEGQPAPWGLPGETIGTIDGVFGLNTSGSILIGNNLNGTASGLSDDTVVLFAGGFFTAVAREGDSISPFLPAPVGGTGGTWDDQMDTCRLLDDGSLFWRAGGVDGLTTGTANDAFLVLGANNLQERVDVPLGQAGGATEPWGAFDFEDLHITGDGTGILVQGDLEGSTSSDDVVVLNGIVVLQEGQVIPGSSFGNPIDTNGIVLSTLDSNGNWWASGNNDASETDWVVRNGVVVAESSGSDEIITGSGENWDDAQDADCFFGYDGNATGAYVICGETDANAASNTVIVYDDGTGNRVVVAREGDPVDADENGLFDDNLFLASFPDEQLLLLEDGSVVYTAILRNATFTNQHAALFRAFPTQASCAVRNGTGVNPLACDCTTLPQLGTNWEVSCTPGPNTIFTLMFASSLPLPGPFPLFGGEALVAPTDLRLPATGPASHSVLLPPDLIFAGVEFFLQGLRLNLVGGQFELELTNAVDAVVGFP